jgi:NAD(P)-dependent dehydrogenase (short-subunit alcohol dehydrogenase family)
VVEAVLRGKRAVISGGAGDIGAQTAAQLVREGAHVFVLDRKPEHEAAPWLEIVSRAGDSFEYVELDTTLRNDLESFFAEIDAVDIAIGNAGVGAVKPFLELDDELWQKTLDVNLTGCFRFGQTAARRMVEDRKEGRIIFTGSWVGRTPWPDIAAYSVSKAALRMLAKQMARELAEHRILVNLVAPGILNAGLAGARQRADAAYADSVKRMIPLGALQTPEQVADAILFLCSPAADYMTGSELLIDGGCSLFKFT